MSETDDFYRVASWRIGTGVRHRDGRTGVLVRRAARFWVDRDTKPPMVRFDRKLDAVEVPWHELELR